MTANLGAQGLNQSTRGLEPRSSGRRQADRRKRRTLIRWK
jgi:hypothetical protein